MNKTDQAHATFEEGMKTATQKLSQTTDVGVDWNDWIIGHALMREAQALLEPGQSGTSK